MRHIPTPLSPCAHVRDAAPAYAANTDAPFWDLLAVVQTMADVPGWPLNQVEALVARFEAAAQPLEAMTVRQLMRLVLEVQP